MIEPPTGAGGRPPVPARELGLEVLATLIERSVDGVAVLDEDLRILYVNAAAAEILGVDPAALRDESALHTVPEPTREVTREVFRQMRPGAGRGTGTIVRPDGDAREIEYTHVAFDVAARKVFAGFFRDITGLRRGHQRERAFARIAASVAFGESLETTLDGLAASVAEATGMTACAVVVCDDPSSPLRVAGTHGLPPEYPARFRAALDDGAHLPAAEAVETGQTVIVRRAATQDPALGSVGTLDQDLRWATMVCLPMSVRSQAVGALKCFYGAGGIPGPDGTAFLAAVADQAAVAVDNARWFARAAESRRHQETLVQAGMTFASELSLPTVLERVVEFGCHLTDARRGALAVVAPDGGAAGPSITHGTSATGRTGIDDQHLAQGVLATVLEEGRVLRGTTAAGGSTAAGSAPHERPGASLLAVPIALRGRTYGGVCVIGKRGGRGFTDDDERSLVTLAAQAGVAIENARLFSEAQERLGVEARHRLARELHDSVSQAMFSMTLEARAAQLAMEQEGIDRSGPVGSRLSRLRELTQGALAEMRALIFELRPEALSEEGLVAALQKHADGIRARSGIVVDIDVPGATSLTADAEEQLYRVAQEALNNAAKHAGAGHASVRLVHTEAAPARLVLEVADDGTGFDPSSPRPGHLGLTTMRQRVERLGGTFEVRSAPGRGTTVHVEIPALPPPADGDGRDGRAPEHHGAAGPRP